MLTEAEGPEAFSDRLLDNILQSILRMATKLSGMTMQTVGHTFQPIVFSLYELLSSLCRFAVTPDDNILLVRDMNDFTEVLRRNVT